MANRKFEFDTDGFQYYNDNYVKHPSKSATTGTSGAHPYNGMGRVVLKKNMVSNVNTLTQAMVSTANTIYVIKYDYVLGANITVPANCVLEFDGGSISGAFTLTGNNTKIKADDIHCFNLNVNFAGTWIGAFNIYWLGLVSNDNTFNNAPIIQKALRIFPDTYIPKGDYYCSTTIEASPHTVEMHDYPYPEVNFNCLGVLHYITKNTANTFIQIGGFGSKIYINDIVGPNSNITDNNEKSIGISLYDCNSCLITIGGVSGFYKNVEFLGGTLGFAYNDITIVDTGAAVILTHLNNVEGGWVNSNRFKFLRMHAYGGQTKADTAILAKGIEGGSGFNENVFEKLSIEGINKSGAGAPIKLTKCSDFIIGPFRNENNNIPFISTSGDCKNIKLIPNYYSHNTPQNFKISAQPNSKIEYTEPLNFVYDWKPFANSVIENDNYICNCAYTTDLSHVITPNAPGYYPIMALFNRDIINLPIRMDLLSNRGSIQIAYYDSNKNLLDRNDYLNYTPTCSYGLGSSAVNNKLWASTGRANSFTFVIPNIPDTISYIGIGVTLVEENFSCIEANELTIKFSSNIPIKMLIDTPSIWGTGYRVPSNARGTSQKRLASTDIGSMYFDTTLGKPIWYKGNDVWVDATGTTV